MVLGLITAFIVAWIVDIACRPCVNVQGLKGALNARSRSKAGTKTFMQMESNVDLDLAEWI